MLTKENRDDPLIRALFEPGTGRRPALLMLSATPYKLFATRLEENRGTEANREFFDLMEFLGGARGAELKASAEDALVLAGLHRVALLLAQAVTSVPIVMKTAVNVKLLLPPRQSRGNSLGH